MSSVGRNVLANFVARAAVGLMTIAFAPVYLSRLGIEAYGVVGAFAAVQAIFYVFDFGLGLTLNRQLARLTTEDGQNSARRMRDAVRTFEVVYWCIGVVLGGLIVFTGLAFSSSWFHASELPSGDVATAMALMGVALAIQWPSLLYLGGLLGVQRQLSANVILATTAIVRSGGAVIVLTVISPTLQAFFVWQIVASVFQTVGLRLRLSQVLPRAESGARFVVAIIRANVGFAADLTAITILGTVLIQLDKVILSRSVPLREFGYYALAGTVASSLNLFASPIFNATFPRLAAAEVTGGVAATRRTYHQSCQLMSVLLWPVALVLIAFAPEVLYLWLGVFPSETTVLLVRILVAGSAFNALMNVPYALMLASGQSKIPLLLNLAAVVVFVPFIVYMTGRFGTVGGALAWLLLNSGWVSVGIAVMHRKLLQGEAGTWYRLDVGLPLLGAMLATAAFRFMMGAIAGRAETAVLLALCGAFALLGASWASNFVRRAILGWIRSVFRVSSQPGPLG